MLAAGLQLPLFPLALYVEWKDGLLALLRGRGVSQQWHRPGGTLVATVTNDRRNKLRHPLMKNVMMAKKMTFDSVDAPAQSTVVLNAEQLLPAREVQRGGHCRMLEGDVNSQAATLVTYLRGEQPA